MGRNTIRVAEVWLDEYKEFVYKVTILKWVGLVSCDPQNNPSYRSYKYGDVSDRRLLRERLQCRSFSWYLDKVYPELEVPTTVSTMKPSSAFIKTLYKGMVSINENFTDIINGYH